MCSYLLSGIRLYQKLIENGTFDVCKKSFVTRQELNNRDGQNHNVEFHNQNFIGNVYQDFDLTIFFILALLAGPPREVRQMFCLDLVVAW